MQLDPSYDLKTIDELKAEFVDLGNQVGTISAKHQAIHALIEKRMAEAKAAAQVADLTPIEKDALKRALESRAQQQ